MINSRFWISVSAFFAAAMVIWALFSLTIISFRDIPDLCGPGMCLGFLAACFTVAAFSWIYIYKRPRGGIVLVPSRIGLSFTSLVAGVAIAFALIGHGYIEPIDFDTTQTWKFIAFVVATALPIASWSAVFCSSRKPSKSRA